MILLLLPHPLSEPGQSVNTAVEKRKLWKVGGGDGGREEGEEEFTHDVRIDQGLDQGLHLVG